MSKIFVAFIAGFLISFIFLIRPQIQYKGKGNTFYQGGAMKCTGWQNGKPNSALENLNRIVIRSLGVDSLVFEFQPIVNNKIESVYATTNDTE